MSRERILYNLLIALLSMPILIWTVWQGWRRGGGWRFIGRRLGLVPIAPQRGGWWFHAASVGEVNGLVPLLQWLHHHRPEQPLQLTTTTPQGLAAARRQLPDLRCDYLPLDGVEQMRVLLRQLQPQRLILMETELWPNLLAVCHHARLPVTIINGRLSAQTLRAPRWLQRLYGQGLTECDAIYCRAELDRQRFIQLGAAADRCFTLGNLKYAAIRPATPPPSPIIPTDRPYLLLASTREGEERLLIEALQQLPPPHHRLWVIAPRHPQRADRITRSLRHLPLARHSRQEPITATTAIYLLDQIGLLTAAAAGAELVVMGGSFVPKGGHNLLEPAALGKAVIVGPYMENFAAETADLLEQQAVVQVANTTELVEQLTRLLADPQQRQQLGERAAALLQQRAAVVETYGTRLLGGSDKPLP